MSETDVYRRQIVTYSVKRSDVTRRKQGYIRTLPHTSLC